MAPVRLNVTKQLLFGIPRVPRSPPRIMGAQQAGSPPPRSYNPSDTNEGSERSTLHMTPDPLHDTAEPVAAPDAVRAGRRRLLRGGLASAPVLLSLTSRPVAATTCRPASAFASANVSRPGASFSCGGKRPDFWKQPCNFAHWPLPRLIPSSTDVTGCAANYSAPRRVTGEPYPATRFGEVFAQPSSAYTSMTLLEVLSLGSDTHVDGLAKHVVAALLNAAKGYTPADVLSEAILHNMWYSFLMAGFFEPTAGIQWRSDEMIAWIRTTMPT